jgi:hypothetical protein
MKKQKERNKEKTEKTLPGPAQRAKRRERDGDPFRKERELVFPSMPQPDMSVTPGHSYLALDASVPRLNARLDSLWASLGKQVPSYFSFFFFFMSYFISYLVFDLINSF